jgi:hypothetical protein
MAVTLSYHSAGSFRAIGTRTEHVTSFSHPTNDRLHAFSARPSGAGVFYDLRYFAHVGHQRCTKRLVARRAIKWIETFETQLDIPDERRKALEDLLENETFCSQVMHQPTCSIAARNQPPALQS